MLTEEGLRALTMKIVTPHPPASAGTFSHWEKESRVLYDCRLPTADCLKQHSPKLLVRSPRSAAASCVRHLQ